MSILGNVDGGTDYVFPDSRARNSRLVCDDDGEVHWLDNGAIFNEISGGLGVEVATIRDFYPAADNISNRQAIINLRLGNGLNIDIDGNIQINFDDITTCDITEGTGCNNLWYSDERVFNMLEAMLL